jgi:chaperonin GroEL (HSP60 family)
VNCVKVDRGDGTFDIDVKKYAKVEKIPGGSIEDCRVLKGVMFAKDIVNPGRMSRRVRAKKKKTILGWVVIFGCGHAGQQEDSILRGHGV